MDLPDFRLAYRRLLRQKVNTTVHIVGLTMGMSVCLLIGLFLHFELSFDNYHPNARNIYRINSTWTDVNRETFIFSTPIPLADALRKEVSGIGEVALVHPVWESRSIVEINPQKRFRQEHILIAEPSYTEIFKIEPIIGDPGKVLRKPFQALLTESTATKFYGDENPVGKVFKLNNEFEITVGGIIKDIPVNSHQPASMLLSYVHDQKFLGTDINNWTVVSGSATYVIIPDTYPVANLQSQLDRMADKYANSDATSSYKSGFDVQPLRTIHFESKYAGGSEWVKSINTDWLWFFAAIGISVLFLACINFVNLSTAQALNRAKEVGVLKSIGAGRLHLISLFLREALVLTSIAGLLSIGVAQLMLPYMNSILDKQITFELFESPIMIMVLLAGILLTALLAGSYPAYLITQFNASQALRSGSGRAGKYGSSSWLRKALVVTQFTVAVGLLISVIMIARQVDFLRDRNLGFDQDNIIKVDITDAKKAATFKAELDRIPQIEDVAFGTSTPSDGGHWRTIMSTQKSDDKNRQPLTLLMVDENYCRMYGFKLLAGRFPEVYDSAFTSPRIPKEQKIIKAVVNETAVRELGYSSNEAALHQRFWIGLNGGNAEIVGVVADFNTTSLHEAIKPTLITLSSEFLAQAGIKITQGAHLPATIAAIEVAWRNVFPEGIFQFTFLDQQIEDFYRSEGNLYRMFRIFAGLAMVISCLGLWGLTTYSAQQRTKEIGIRKVLGATLKNIVALLSRDLLSLVLIAILLAAPLSFILIRNWLDNYAFKAPIGWSVFAIASTASVIIALATVSIQAIKAGLTNPTDSLRSE